MCVCRGAGHWLAETNYSEHFFSDVNKNTDNDLHCHKWPLFPPVCSAPTVTIYNAEKTATIQSQTRDMYRDQMWGPSRNHFTGRAVYLMLQWLRRQTAKRDFFVWKILYLCPDGMSLKKWCLWWSGSCDIETASVVVALIFRPKCVGVGILIILEAVRVTLRSSQLLQATLTLYSRATAVFSWDLKLVKFTSWLQTPHRTEGASWHSVFPSRIPPSPTPRLPSCCITGWE